MSWNVKIIAGLLGSIAIAILWFGRGGESSSPAETPERNTHATSVFEKPKRPMLLEQPAMRGELGDAESRRPAMMKDRLDTRGEKLKERKMAGKQRKRPAVSAEEEEEDFAHWRDIALNDPDADERADALTQLDYDDPEAMAVLVMALQDQDADVRMTALNELWVNAEEPPLDILAPVIDDPEAEIRAEAVRMIADSDDPAAAPLLERAMADPDEDVRDEAADALDLDDDQIQ